MAGSGAGLSGDPGSATETVDDVTSDQVPVIRDPTDGLFRCEWAGNDPLMVAYHDEEWGVPAMTTAIFSND